MMIRQNFSHHSYWKQDLRYVLVLMVALFLSSTVGAQNLNPADHFIIDPPEREIIVGQTFKVTIKLPFDFDITASDIPIDGNVQLVDQGSTFQNTIINGKRYSSASRTFVFQTFEEGTITVGPVLIDYSPQQIKFDSLQVEVKSIESFGIERFEIPELGTIAHPIAENAKKMRELTGKYFSAVEAPEKVYEGQVFPLITYLYKINDQVTPWVTSTDLQPPDSTNIINVESFTTKKTNDMVELALDDKYLRIPFHARFVLPVRTGEMELSGARIPAGTLTRRFFSFDHQFDLPSPTRTIEVMPLPDPGQPVNTKLTGVIQVATNYPSKEMETGDVLTLEVMLSGQSYLKPVSLSVPEDIPGLLYLGTTSDFRMKSSGQIPVLSEKKFQIKYQILEPGDYSVPPLVVAAFDPDTEKYSIQSTPEYRFTATGEPSTTVSLGANSSIDPGKLPSNMTEIDPVIPNESQSLPPISLARYEEEMKGSRFFSQEPNTTILYVANSVVIGLGGLYFVLQGFIIPSAWYRNRNTRNSKFRQIENHLNLARKAAKNQDADIFYQESERFLAACFQESFGFNLRGLESSDLRAQLKMHLPDELVSEVMTLRERLDTWRYAPDAKEQSLDREASLLERVFKSSGAAT